MSAQSTSQLADMILGFLAENGAASKSDISGKLFKRNMRARDIDEAIQSLLDESKINQTKAPRENNGRAAVLYEIFTKNQAPCGLQALTPLQKYERRVRDLQKEYKRQLERARHR